MKTRISAFAAAAVAVAALPLGAAAAGFSAFAGFKDTETFDSSVEFGGQLEFDFVPCLTLVGRGAWAGDFDDVSLGRGFAAHDLSVVPVEVGLLVRPPQLFGFLGIYGGGGAGWYYVPGFDVLSGKKLVAETEETTDLVGFWAGGGLEVGTENFHVFAEAKYTGAKKNDVDFKFKDGHDPHGRLSGTVDLSGMTYSAGIRVSW